MMKKILLCFVMFLLVGNGAFAWRYDNSDWRFRIDKLSDSVTVDESQWYKTFTCGSEKVLMLTLYQSSEVKWEELMPGQRAYSSMTGEDYTKRFTYHFLKKMDYIYLEGLDSTFNLQYEGRKPFSCRLTRIHESPQGQKIKTVAYYTPNVIYFFVQSYKDEPSLLDSMTGNFSSSLINSSDGLFAIWEDVITGEKNKGFRSFVGHTLGFVCRALWPIMVIVFCVFCLIVPFFTARNYWLGSFFIVFSLFAISFFCCHDIFMNWIMGYGPVWKVLLGVVITVVRFFVSLFGG